MVEIVFQLAETAAGQRSSFRLALLLNTLNVAETMPQPGRLQGSEITWFPEYPPGNSRNFREP